MQCVAQLGCISPEKCDSKDFSDIIFANFSTFNIAKFSKLSTMANVLDSVALAKRYGVEKKVKQELRKREREKGS